MRSGSAAANVIVPVTPVRSMTFGPGVALDWVTAHVRDPADVSPAALVTTNVAGRTRPSSARTDSRAGREGGRGGPDRRAARPGGGRAAGNRRRSNFDTGTPWKGEVNGGSSRDHATTQRATITPTSCRRIMKGR